MAWIGMMMDLILNKQQHSAGLAAFTVLKRRYFSSIMNVLVLLNLTALQYPRALQHSSIAPLHESDSRPRHATAKPLSETKANGKCDGRRYSRVPLCHIPQGGTGGLLLPTSKNKFPFFSNPLFSRLSSSKFGTSQNPISQFESHFSIS